MQKKGKQRKDAHPSSPVEATIDRDGDCSLPLCGRSSEVESNWCCCCCCCLLRVANEAVNGKRREEGFFWLLTLFRFGGLGDN